MKREKDLFNKITSIESLQLALMQTAKNKRCSLDYLEFDQWRYSNILNLRNEIVSGRYKVSPYINFKVLDPKPRIITALKFRDRIVQRAIYNHIQPLFEKTFLPNSYACRKGKGTHLAARITQSYLRKPGIRYFLKTDFSKYFMSIDRSALWTEIDKKVGCKKTGLLIEKFIPREGVGINIGELLSQLFANVVGHQFDMLLKHEVKAKYFLRYMDDIVMLGADYSSLLEAKDRLGALASDLGLRFSSWFIAPIESGINFVGYRIYRDFKLIRKSSIKSAKRKLKRLTGEERARFLASWKGHISHANTYNLQKRMGIHED